MTDVLSLFPVLGKLRAALGTRRFDDDPGEGLADRGVIATQPPDGDDTNRTRGLLRGWLDCVGGT